MKKTKKILSLVAAATLLVGAFAGCKNNEYKGDAITGYQGGAVASNGGFAVEQGDFVYFINGAEEYTASNEYGEVVKGSLMRIAKTDLASGDYTKVKTIVPSLFVAQNYDAGIYIYGDYVYYATPTTDKNMAGDVQNTWIDFKRAKLDGSEAPMNDIDKYFFRLSDNSSKYRFVEEGGTVYCLYEEDSALKSFNCKTGKATTLVKGAKSSFFYNESDPTSPYVYYTMSVVTDAETDNSSTADYDQLYCVNAAATVTKFDASKAYYETSNGGKYDFKEAEMNAAINEAKEDKTDAPYTMGDYATYPYVNLGKLVLDGVGSSQETATQFNAANVNESATPFGYTYTITGYKNDGVYFTRAEVTKTSSEGENTKLYYLADASKTETWNAIKGNGSLVTVARDTTNTGSAVFYIENNKHYYLYLNGANITRATLDETPVVFYTQATDATLWQVKGDYLYYYTASESGNGNALKRINCKGTQDNYKPMFFDDAEYTELSFPGVEWNSSWYKPEFVGDKLLYSNEQSFGSTSYNYVYTTDIPATQAELKQVNEAYDAVQEKIDEYTDDTDLQSAMEYYFRTGERKVFDAAYKNELYDANQKESFDSFVALFDATKADALKLENKFITLLGKMKSSDVTAIDEAWVNSLPTPKQDATEETGLEAWAIVLIVVGSVLVVAAGVLVPLFVIRAKKKKAKAQEEASIVNAAKKKIDTTDDQSIDVYAEETTEETATEEAPAEEATMAETVETEASEESTEEEKKDE